MKKIVSAFAMVAAVSVAGAANATGYTDGTGVYNGLTGAYDALRTDGTTGLPTDVSNQLNTFLNTASDQISHTAGRTVTRTIGGVEVSYTTAGSLSGTYSVGDAVNAVSTLVDGVLDDFIGEDTNGVRTTLDDNSLIGVRVGRITTAATTFTDALTDTSMTGTQVQAAHATFVSAVSDNEAAINTAATAAGSLEGISITNRADAMRYSTALTRDDVTFNTRVGQISGTDWATTPQALAGGAGTLNIPTGWSLALNNGGTRLVDPNGVAHTTTLPVDPTTFALQTGGTVAGIQDAIDAAVTAHLSS